MMQQGKRGSELDQQSQPRKGYEDPGEVEQPDSKWRMEPTQFNLSQSIVGDVLPQGVSAQLGPRASSPMRASFL